MVNEEFDLGLKAEIYITKRAMKNFPTMMPILKRHFNAKVVSKTPQLKKDQRAIELCFPYVTFQTKRPRKEWQRMLMGRCYHRTKRWPTAKDCERLGQLVSKDKKHKSVDELAYFLAYGEFPTSQESIQWKPDKPYVRSTSYSRITTACWCVCALVALFLLSRMFL